MTRRLFLRSGLWITGAASCPAIVRATSTFIACPPRVPLDGSIAGLVLWLQADTLALSEGDLVSTWTDYSGVGNHATGSGATRPIFHRNKQHGLSAVSFSTGTYLSCDALASTFSGDDKTGSIFTVVRLANTGGTMDFFTAARSSSANPLYGYGCSGTNYRVLRRDDANASAIPNSSASTINTTIHASTISATVINNWINGTQQITNSAINLGQTTLDKATVGGRNSNGSISSNLLGFMCELLVYSAALSSTDQSKVTNYLNSKWAVY